MKHQAVFNLIVWACSANRLVMGNTRVPDCPEWFYTIGRDIQTQSPDIPGIQLYVSSEKYNLLCKDSFQSLAANYTVNPPLLADSPFRIASVTKPFTALAVLKLVEQGQLDVKAPVSKYLPDWAVATLTKQQGAENANQITPWMLLHHTSGMADHGTETDGAYAKLFFDNPQLRLTPQDVLGFAADHLAPIGAPGAAFHYSDTGYIYLGVMVSEVTGLNIGAAVRKFARLDDLEMPSTYWEIFEEPPKDALPRAGQYYHDVDVTHLDASFDLYGGGGIVSNSHDIGKFAMAVHKGLLLDGPTMKLLYETVPAVESDPTQAAYGCGWVHGTIGGVETWQHTGFWGIWVYYMPSMDLVIAGTVNQNKDASLGQQATERIVENILKDNEAYDGGNR